MDTVSAANFMCWLKCLCRGRDKCAIGYINGEIRNERIPRCLMDECESALTVETCVNMMPNVTYSISRYMGSTLRVLWERKDQFKCRFCSDWHPKGEEAMWMKRCAEANGRVRCVKCKQWLHASRIMEWDIGCAPSIWEKHCKNCLMRKIDGM